MNHTLELQFSAHLLRTAIFRFWWRVTGWRFIAALLLVASSFLIGLLNGDRSWVVGVLGSVLAVGLAFMIALYAVHYRNAIRKFKAMGNPHAQFTISDDSFTVTSGAGTATLRWTSVREIWQFPEVWLVFFSKSQFMTLPIENISQESKTLITQYAEMAGAKVS